MRQSLSVVFSFIVSVGVQAMGQEGVFVVPPQYATATGPVAIAVGDFNGDGKLDVAVSGSIISILLGNGDGTFQTHVDYAVGKNPVSLAVSDLNGDGKPDLAVVNQGSSTVTVLFGNGDGTFQTGTDYGTAGGASSVAVGDFNGDGKLDLAVTNSGSNSVSIFLNSGTGTFPARTDVPTAALPLSVTVGDFNKDGKLDLAAAVSTGVSVLLRKADGTFQTHVDYTAGLGPVSPSQRITRRESGGDGANSTSEKHATDDAPTRMNCTVHSRDGRSLTEKAPYARDSKMCGGPTFWIALHLARL